MTTRQKSKQVGALKDGTIAIPQALPSTNVGNQSTSATLGITAGAKNQTASQLTPNSLVNPLLTYAKIISVFAEKLGKLVEWRKIILPDGREGYVLFFDTKKWMIDPVSIELTPLGVK